MNIEVIEVSDGIEVQDILPDRWQESALGLDMSCIILTHNRAVLLKEVLDRVQSAAKSCRTEIIIVDNGSSDMTAMMLSDYPSSTAPMLVVKLTRNRGIGGGRNVGFKVARGDLIVSMDDDVLLEEDFFCKAREAAGQHLQAGIIAARIIDAKTGTVLNPYGSEKTCEVVNHSGACCVLRRQAIVKAGLIDEKCTYGAEERDLAMKIYDAGFSVIFDPSLHVMHVETVGAAEQLGIDRAATRIFNNIRINFKYLPVHTAALFSSRYFLVMLRVIKWSHWGKAFRAAFSGIVEGVKNHTALTYRTVQYYSRGDLEPDFGNRPLWRKALRSLNRM